MNDINSKIQKKLSSARTRLIMERPFIGALVLRLKLKAAAGWCKSTLTDGKSIYYNSDYIKSLNSYQVQFVLAHNALHCALSHFNRRGTRHKHRWDVACDLAINSMLVGEKMNMPPDALYVASYEGMSAEEIYPLVKENSDKDPLDQHLADSDSSGKSKPDVNENLQKPSIPEGKLALKPKALSKKQQAELSIKWQQRLAGAAQQAAQVGKISERLLKLVEHLLQPAVSWRALLQQYMSESAKDDYTYLRLNNRREGPAIYPSLKSGQVNMAAVLDTSGSISDKELTDFLTEINFLKSQVRARITLIACDEKLVCEPEVFEPWQDMYGLEKFSKGKRGTSFVPPFKWLSENSNPQDLVIYFTDAEGEFPPEPEMNVLWLVKGKAQVPWGRRIQLN